MSVGYIPCMLYLYDLYMNIFILAGSWLKSLQWTTREEMMMCPLLRGGRRTRYCSQVFVCVVCVALVTQSLSPSAPGSGRSGRGDQHWPQWDGGLQGAQLQGTSTYMCIYWLRVSYDANWPHWDGLRGHSFKGTYIHVHVHSVRLSPRAVFTASRHCTCICLSSKVQRSIMKVKGQSKDSVMSQGLCGLIS